MFFITDCRTTNNKQYPPHTYGITRTWIDRACASHQQKPKKNPNPLNRRTVTSVEPSTVTDMEHSKKSQKTYFLIWILCHLHWIVSSPHSLLCNSNHNPQLHSTFKNVQVNCSRITRRISCGLQPSCGLQSVIG